MTDQQDTPYADAVKAFAQKHVTRMSTPGHQVSHQAHPDLIEFFGQDVMELDVMPLVTGIDQGAYPTPYDEALLLAAQAWGARRTWFLTNGASQGNLTACVALASFGTTGDSSGTLVVQRSVHSSVVDGLALSGLDVEFVFPSLDEALGIANGVTPEALDTAIGNAHNPVAAYVVTPSYFGACADVAGLAEVAHRHGIPLIVDEAWGAHFGFHRGYPINAIRLGADVAISSTHKLGGSLGQSAMLHLAEGPYADDLEPLLDRAFKSMQSTSASSLLLASLDLARHSLVTQDPRVIERSLEAIGNIRQEITRRGRFEDVGPALMRYPDVIGLDPMRISINTAIGGISGHEARSILFNDYGIICEMATHSTLVLLIGSGVVPYVAEIVQALHSLPNRYTIENHALTLPRPGQRWTSVRDAYFAPTEVISAENSIGRVSADSVAAYPPGIPNLLPGELITFETVAFLQATIKQPFGHVRGGSSTDMSTFRVVKD
ncbi:MAG: aminotransferase class V-fold PLP-dependent enzyme [Actinobacteria bacterium]|uniref:Unannotated protein n=1 Tax=freshwater metagenome TaxID=449393 RepID=A0A6J5YMG3_9ZZZZ|nr:aminotransferase class V-fold PLP-dependent enzyme [Actinomycetota bacterium]